MSDRLDILLVEDNQADAELVETYLNESTQFEVDFTRQTRLESALEVFDHDRFDCILLDLHLPDSGGKMTIRRVADRVDDTPVVVLTGRHSPDLETYALECGLESLLLKNQLDPELLEQSLHRTFDRSKRRRRELRKYERIVEHATDAITILDLSGEYTFVNSRVEELLGRPRSEIVGCSPEEVFDPETAETIASQVRRTLEDGRPITEKDTRELPSGPTTLLTTRIPYRVDGEVQGTIAVARDVTEEERMQEELEQRSLYDSLTDLPKPDLFRNRVSHALNRARRQGLGLAVGFIDLDRFTKVNRSLGHRAGDRLLKRAGDRIRSALRDKNLVSRVGGDEFVMLLEDAGIRSNLHGIGERLSSNFEPPFEIHGEQVHLSASIGFVHAAPGALRDADAVDIDAERLIGRARRAMQFADRSNGTCWRIRNALTERDDQNQIELENAIRKGIELGEFIPFVHPVHSLADGEVVALEVLARWLHPDRGVVGPGEFIPLAEQSGLLDKMTRSLVERSSRDLARTVDLEAIEGPIYLNVNFTPGQITHENLIASTREAIVDQTDGRFEISLEVTEQHLLENLDAVARLSAEGTRIVVDDFGSGFSSLSRLKEMPMDALKLDMEFVQGFVESDKDAAIVETVTELGRQLGVPVVAEGVEDSVQLEAMREAGCSAVQGFLFGCPAPIEAYADLERATGISQAASPTSREFYDPSSPHSELSESSEFS